MAAAISALVFGISFFAVVGSTTAFVRFNYPPDGWPNAIAAMTIAFGIGQTLGPIVVGADHRCVRQPVLCLERRAAMLALGAVAAAFQKKLVKDAVILRSRAFARRLGDCSRFPCIRMVRDARR